MCEYLFINISYNFKFIRNYNNNNNNIIIIIIIFHINNANFANF